MQQTVTPCAVVGVGVLERGRADAQRSRCLIVVASREELAAGWFSPKRLQRSTEHRGDKEEDEEEEEEREGEREEERRGKKDAARRGKDGWTERIPRESDKQQCEENLGVHWCRFACFCGEEVDWIYYFFW